jgi:hypothetical protein
MTDNERNALVACVDFLLALPPIPGTPQRYPDRLLKAADALDAEAHAAPQPTTEPAAVIQALVERLNPVTPAEAARDLVETLVGLVSRAVTQGHDYTAALAFDLRDAQVPIYEAMQGMPRAARQSAPQGGHQDADAYYDALQADAARDAHSPGWAYQGPDGVIDPHGALRGPGTGRVG